MNDWYSAFLANPNQAISDLFSGRAGLGSSLRLDVAELLYQEFPDTPEYAQPREQLDLALLHWLTVMRRDYAMQVKRLGYGVYSKRLCDALTAVQLLDLPRTIYQLRETASSWLNCLTPLRLAPERDPALEYWRVLSHRQTENASSAPWLQLAKDPRREYLQVALVGLQRLPNDHNARRNQQTQLMALLHHAVQLPHVDRAREVFTQYYAALRATYPAAPDYWQQLLEIVSNEFKREVKTPIAKALVEIIKHDIGQSKLKKTSVLPVLVQATNKEERLDLLHAINKSKSTVEVLAARLFALLDKEYAYSQASGDSFTFVHMLSEQGTALLKKHSLTNVQLNQLQHIIERALSLAPMNPFIWLLWADCLAHLHYYDAQQWVLREAVRLFPNNEPSRVELARLLMRLGNDKDAEYYLREAVERNPNNEPSRVELARLLMRLGNDKDAEYYLREVVERNPNNEPSRVELARLLMRLGNDKEAEYYLREVVERNPNDEHSRVELARLLIQRYYKDSQENENQIKEAEDLLKEIIEHNFKDGQSHVVLAKLWLKQTRISEAKDLLTQYLSYCPQKNKVRELLIGIKNNSFNASTWLEFDNDTIINPPKTNNTPHNNHSVNHTMPENLTDLLTELQRRAQLQIEFNQATHLETIETQAKQGDALAYFYWQWLQPEIDLKAPPHAWSAQACRLYQTHADKENWQVLKQSFPEYQEITRFLQLQTHADEKETTLLLDKLSSDNETLSPMQQFIYKALKNNKTDNKIVLAVLSSAAISPPQFVNC